MQNAQTPGFGNHQRGNHRWVQDRHRPCRGHSVGRELWFSLPLQPTSAWRPTGNIQGLCKMLVPGPSLVSGPGGGQGWARQRCKNLPVTLGLSRDRQQALSDAAVGGRGLLGRGLECDSTVRRQGQQLPPPEVTKKGEVGDIRLRAPILHGRGKERCPQDTGTPALRPAWGLGLPSRGCQPGDSLPPAIS